MYLSLDDGVIIIYRVKKQFCFMFYQMYGTLIFDLIFIMASAKEVS